MCSSHIQGLAELPAAAILGSKSTDWPRRTLSLIWPLSLGSAGGVKRRGPSWLIVAYHAFVPLHRPKTEGSKRRDVVGGPDTFCKHDLSTMALKKLFCKVESDSPCRGCWLVPQWLLLAPRAMGTPDQVSCPAQAWGAPGCGEESAGRQARCLRC